jgi:GT2 family glycosyltransferase
MNHAAPVPTKVTVYIPAYNAAEYLAPCIQSLLDQTLPADEILVIDDGSSDATSEIAARYSRVTLIRHPHNKGLAAARNTAMRAARNEFLAAIDSDCCADRSWLAELAKHLQDAAVIGVGGKLVEGVQRTVADRWRAVHMAQQWGDTLVRNPRFLFGCNTLYRKSALLEVGGFDERMRTAGEDTDLGERFRAKGFSTLYDPAACVTHLRHDNTRSVLDASWRWWRFGVNAYAHGVKLRSVLGHALFVHFRYNFLESARKDLLAHRWSLLAFDFLLLVYFPYKDFRLWLSARFGF